MLGIPISSNITIMGFTMFHLLIYACTEALDTNYFDRHHPIQVETDSSQRGIPAILPLQTEHMTPHASYE